MQIVKSSSLFPALLVLATLGLLLFKLPGVTALFTPFDCTRCTVGAPLITWVGAGYFAALLALLWLCPSFPSRAVASCGMLFAIALGFLLLWLSPAFCWICFFAHLFHVLFWGYFLLYPRPGVAFHRETLKKGLLATQMGLLTFLGYYAMDDALFFYLGQSERDQVPPFVFIGADGKRFGTADLAELDYAVFHFVLAECRYCKKQLPVLDALAEKFGSKKIAFFNIIVERHQESDQELLSSVHLLAPHMQSVIDHKMVLGKEFDVRTFPTLYVIDAHGHIVKHVIGTFSSLQFELDELFSKHS